MQRRRFFPARPVQQVPGRRVELAVQVRKEGGEATAPAPTPVAPVPLLAVTLSCAVLAKPRMAFSVYCA